MAMATSPQCKPKITRTCQNAPTSNPANNGLKLYKPIAPAPIKLAAHVEIGPIIKNVNGTIIINVKNGTKNAFTTSGITFFKNFSNLDAKNTENTIGITLCVYVIDMTGMPKNVKALSDSKNVPLKSIVAFSLPKAIALTSVG